MKLLELMTVLIHTTQGRILIDEKLGTSFVDQLTKMSTEDLYPQDMIRQKALKKKQQVLMNRRNKPNSLF
jgi:hypothetical protein